MIPIYRYMSRTARRMWNRSPEVPRYIGCFVGEHYGRPVRWHAWLGRHPRNLEFCLFGARLAKSRPHWIITTSWTYCTMDEVRRITGKPNLTYRPAGDPNETR